MENCPSDLCLPFELGGMNVHEEVAVGVVVVVDATADVEIRRTPPSSNVCY